MYEEIETTKALNKLKSRLPYNWDLNIYRWCIHQCKYCYAIYSHQYLDSKDFFGKIFIKKNIVELLDKELSSPKWKWEIINIWSVTDSYQQIEQERQTMRWILKVMIKHKNPIIISTKSNLILRDIDLIDELSKLNYVNIACTITSMDENIRQQIEPGWSSSIERFNALKELRKTNASIGVHMMPILPYITDNKENIEMIFKKSSEIWATYLLTWALYLRGSTRTYYLNFIKKQFPHLYNKYLEIYKTGAANKEYKDSLYKIVNHYRQLYNVSSSYSKPIKEKLKPKIPTLFD